MRLKTKKITICAMMAALIIVFMFVGTLFPTGRMGFMAVASLFSVAVVTLYGYTPALLVYVVSVILGFLLLPDKAPIAFYALFFGYYPVIKSIAENFKKSASVWFMKLVVFNVALTVIYIFMRELLMLRFIDKFADDVLGFAIYIIFNIVFIVYDIGLSRLIGFYMTNIYNKIR